MSPEEIGADGKPVESPGPRMLKVLTFEVGPFLFAVPASKVLRIAAPKGALPDGTSVVDALGLLKGRAEAPGRKCLVLLQPEGNLERVVAFASSGAGEVTSVDLDRLLPLPGFLFPGENPFLGLIPPSERGSDRAIFLLAGPERILAGELGVPAS